MLLRKYLTHNYSIFEVARKTSYAVKFTPASPEKVPSINEVVYVIHCHHVATNQRNLKSVERVFQTQCVLFSAWNRVPPHTPNLESQSQVCVFAAHRWPVNTSHVKSSGAKLFTSTPKFAAARSTAPEARATKKFVKEYTSRVCLFLWFTLRQDDYLELSLIIVQKLAFIRSSSLC